MQRQILLSDPKGKHVSLHVKDDAVDGSADLNAAETIQYKRWKHRFTYESTMDAELVC